MSVGSFFSKLGKGMVNGLRKTGNALLGGITGLFGGAMGISAVFSLITLNWTFVKPLTTLWKKSKNNWLYRSLTIALGIVLFPIAVVATYAAFYIGMVPGTLYGTGRGAQIGFTSPKSTSFLKMLANAFSKTYYIDFNKRFGHLLPAFLRSSKQNPAPSAQQAPENKNHSEQRLIHIPTNTIQRPTSNHKQRRTSTKKHLRFSSNQEPSRENRSGFNPFNPDQNQDTKQKQPKNIQENRNNLDSKKPKPS